MPNADCRRDNSGQVDGTAEELDTAGLTQAGRSAQGSGGAFGALRDRHFRAWFLSQLVSGSGNMTQAVGLSWLILRLTGSAIDLSLVGVCTFGPSLVLATSGGMLSQRWPRRSILLATQVLLLCSSMVLFVLVRVGVTEIWLLLLVSLVGGIVTAVDGPARQLFIRDLVGAGGVASAVSLYEVGQNAARVLGPALGGALLAVSGPDTCILANGLSFIAPLAVLLRIPPAPPDVDADVLPTRGAIRRALRYVADSPEIKVCLCVAVALGMIFNAGTVLPIMTRDVLHRGGVAYGSLLTAFGLGALPGALMAGRISEPTGRSLRVLVGTTGAAVVVTAASISYPMMLVGEFAIGFASIWTVAAANTMVQLKSRSDMRGPVMGLWVSAVPGTNPITGPLMGAIAQLAGGRPAFALPGIALALVMLAGWRTLSRT